MIRNEGDANATELRPDPFSFSIRIAGFFAALFLIYGVHVPFFAVWLDWRGLSASEIGIIMAAPYLLRLIVTPSVAVFADHHRSHRQTIIALTVLATVLALSLKFASGFWPVLLIAVPFLLAITTIMPLAETVAVAGVKAAGADYGRMRLWGSLTFIVASFAAGLTIDDYGAGLIAPMLAATAAITAAAAYLLPRPAAAAPDDPNSSRRLAWHDAARLASSPLFLIFLLAAGAVQGAHAMLYTFGAVHWRGQGLSTAWVGVLWAVGITAEIMVFAWSAALIERYGASRLMLIGSIAAAVRWVIMAFDPPLVVLFPLQALHGLTYGAAHAGAIRFIQTAVPETSQGSAQAFYATIAAGVAHGAATMLSGWLYGSLQGGTYFIMALMALIGVAASLTLARRWDGGRIHIHD